jgi:hypothetical protein
VLRTLFLLSFVLALAIQCNAGAITRHVNNDDDESALIPTSHGPPEHPWFSYFQVAGIFAMQDPNSYEFTGEISWNPTVCLSNLFCLRGNFGLSESKNQNISNTSFLVTDYELLTAFYVDSGFLELGGGVQNWPGNGGIIPAFSGNLAWPLRKSILGFIERFFVGYTLCLSSYEITHEIKIGFGVAF